MDQILPHPFGLTILGDYLYWTDWQEHTVERARKISGEDRRVLISHLEGLMSLQAASTRPDQVYLLRKKYWYIYFVIYNFNIECTCEFLYQLFSYPRLGIIDAKTLTVAVLIFV